MVKSICDEEGLGGYKTNHSLRSTAAIRLYEADVDEQLITEITGHSSSAVRNYKRTSDSKRGKKCSIVQGTMENASSKSATCSSGSCNTTDPEESKKCITPGNIQSDQGFAITLNLNVQNK